MPTPRRFSSTTWPIPGLPTAVVTVPLSTLSAPSREASNGSLATPFCRLSMAGSSRPVAISESRKAGVSKDLRATTATS